MATASSAPPPDSAKKTTSRFESWGRYPTCDATVLPMHWQGDFPTMIEFTGQTGHWVRVNPARPDLAHANEVAQGLESNDPAAFPYVVRLD